jgi:hypothetical protein
MSKESKSVEDDPEESEVWDGVRTDKNIVFDLDATLINTFSEISSMKKLKIFSDHTKRHLRKRVYTIELHDVVDEPGTGVYSRMWGVYRYGWERFYEFCKRYFNNIYIWSAGQPRYVDAIVDVLFPDPDFQPKIVYTWNNCVSDGDNIYKPLKAMLRDSEMDKDATFKNTYIVDDRDDTFSLNENNGILIPIYDPVPTEKSIMKPENKLLQLEAWLSKKSVAESKDIRRLYKSDIFTWD